MMASAAAATPVCIIARVAPAISPITIAMHFRLRTAPIPGAIHAPAKRQEILQEWWKGWRLPCRRGLNGVGTLAARHSIPAIFPFREDATAGGLIGYGPNNEAMFHVVGT